MMNKSNSVKDLASLRLEKAMLRSAYQEKESQLEAKYQDLKSNKWKILWATLKGKKSQESGTLSFLNQVAELILPALAASQPDAHIPKNLNELLALLLSKAVLFVQSRRKRVKRKRNSTPDS